MARKYKQFKQIKRIKRKYKPVVLQSPGGGYNIKIPTKVRADNESMRALAHQLVDYAADHQLSEGLTDMVTCILEISGEEIMSYFVGNLITEALSPLDKEKKLTAANAKPRRKKKISVKSKRPKLKRATLKK